jgi:hypothetical protein
MLQASETFKELMDSNVRPKCEPIIRVSGIGADGTDVNLEWTGKNIKSLTYKRSIDILGREIPSMELTWTEVYDGELDAAAQPVKYNNVAKYMVVELSFVQDLKMRSSWKDLKESGVTWKSLRENGVTWRQLKNTPRRETITLPKMFLSARPTIQGKTITWTAVDVLSFLTQAETKGFFDFAASSGLPFANPMVYMLVNARSAFLSVPTIFDAITKSIAEIQKLDEPRIDRKFITSSATNDFLKNYCATRNLHIDFADDTFVVKRHEKAHPVYRFTGKVMRQYPAITNNPSISEYRYKAFVWTEQSANTKQIAAVGRLIYENQGVSDFWYGGYGVVTNMNGVGTVKEVDHTSSALESPNGGANVVPVDYIGQDQTIFNNIYSGEVYNEENPVFPYKVADVNIFRANNENRSEAQIRFDFIKDYFDGRCTSLEFEGLPNITLETGDIVLVDTDLKNGNERITKTAVIVGTEITYNGVVMEKIKAHEVVL